VILKKIMATRLIFLNVKGISRTSVLIYFSAHDWIMIALSMIGKLGVSAGFGEVFIYTGEMFPTVVRSFVLGICSCAARVGSSISSYMYDLVSISSFMYNLMSMKFVVEFDMK
jgi:hypothetical protein